MAWVGGSVGGRCRGERAWIRCERGRRECSPSSVGQGGTSSSGNALINPLEGGCIGAIETRRRGFGYNRRLLRRRRGGGHGRVREQGRRQRKGVDRGWLVATVAAGRQAAGRQRQAGTIRGWEVAAVGRHRDRRRCSIHDVNFARVCGCTLYDRVESNR